MSKYKCPVGTCNVSFDGSPFDIAPQAIGHASGSHGVDISENDVYSIIQQQAMAKDRPPIDINTWWSKFNQ